MPANKSSTNEFDRQHLKIDFDFRCDFRSGDKDYGERCDSLYSITGWERAHVIGHSIGAMIACKLAAMVPNRVLSLGLLNHPEGQYSTKHDVVAQICHARSLAEKLKPVARMMKLDGGHLVSHERTKEVNQASRADQGIRNEGCPA
ncbi:hypothetical protein NL676_029043 [Syzygium grande]|nr:hypothetical protein NL676_029043 [Syzygium grande]